MNCNTVRTYFYAFIDSELNVERNIEILAHLDMCYECSKRIEIERHIQSKVKDSVLSISAPDSLKTRIATMANPRPGFFALLKEKFFAHGALKPIGAFVSLLLIITAFFMILGYNVENEAFHVAESDYHYMLMNDVETDIRSQNIDAIKRYILDNVGLDVALPDFRGNTKLIGAALSSINDKNVPLVYYMIGNVPAALYISKDFDLDLSKAKRERVNDMVIYKTEGDCGDCKIISWQGNNNQYIMISKINSNRMIGVLTRV